jgi:hypothetical protein
MVLERALVACDHVFRSELRKDFVAKKIVREKYASADEMRMARAQNPEKFAEWVAASHTHKVLVCVEPCTTEPFIAARTDVQLGFERERVAAFFDEFGESAWRTAIVTMVLEELMDDDAAVRFAGVRRAKLLEPFYYIDGSAEPNRIARHTLGVPETVVLVRLNEEWHVVEVCGRMLGRASSVCLDGPSKAIEPPAHDSRALLELIASRLDHESPERASLFWGLLREQIHALDRVLGSHLEARISKLLEDAADDEKKM